MAIGKTDLSAEKVLSFVQGMNEPMGYILSMKFEGGSGEEMQQDLIIPNPEKPKETLKVVGVLDGDDLWDGGKEDPCNMQYGFSQMNDGIYENCLLNEDGTNHMEAEFLLADFDANGKKYWSYWSTDGKPFKFAIVKGSSQFVRKFTIQTKPIIVKRSQWIGWGPSQQFHVATTPTRKVKMNFGGNFSE